jgi:hypothetical protein
MVQGLEDALLRLHSLSTLPPYRELTPIPATQQGSFDSARVIWDKQGKPGREGNADFERALLEYMNIAAVEELIKAKTLRQSVADWKWAGSREQFPRGGYLIVRDILYDSDYQGPPQGGAEINPET